MALSTSTIHSVNHCPQHPQPLLALPPQLLDISSEQFYQAGGVDVGRHGRTMIILPPFSEVAGPKPKCKLLIENDNLS